jgi:hypothetical protein
MIGGYRYLSCKERGHFGRGTALAPPVQILILHTTRQSLIILRKNYNGTSHLNSLKKAYRYLCTGTLYNNNCIKT